MSDNSHPYFEIVDPDGVVSISHQVVASIAAAACTETPGVAGLAAVPEAAAKGVVVRAGEGAVCDIDVHIFVKQGFELSGVAQEAQEAVKTAVDTGVGIEPRTVNVYVAGVS